MGSNAWTVWIFDEAGNLYGTTTIGSMEGVFGMVFRLTPSNGAWQENILPSVSPPRKTIIPGHSSWYSTRPATYMARPWRVVRAAVYMAVAQFLR